jgi:hypothetical protein
MRPRPPTHAVLVALRIGHPIEDAAWRIAALVDQRRPEALQPFGFLAYPIAAHVEVKVHSILVDLLRLFQLEQDAAPVPDPRLLVDRVIGMPDRDANSSA